MAGVALKRHHPPPFFDSLLFFVYSTKTNIESKNNNRKVCVTVGLSSEVCLLPTTNSYKEVILPIILDYIDSPKPRVT